MRKLATTIAILGLLGLSSTALAQKAKKGEPKVKTYDFSGDTIEGDLVRPEGTGVDAIDVTAFSSLIRIRKEFIAEIIKAAEDL